MTQHDRAETVLAHAFLDYADAAPVEIDASALAARIARGAVGRDRGATRPSTFGSRRAGSRGRRGWHLLAAAALLLVPLLVGTVFVGSRPTDRRQDAPVVSVAPIATAPSVSPPPPAAPSIAFQAVDLPSEERLGHATVVLPDGRILVAGGSAWFGEEQPTHALIADVARGVVVRADGLPVLGNGPAAGLLPDGTVLVVGDARVARPLDRLDTGVPRAARFDPASGRSTGLRVPYLQPPRFGSAASWRWDQRTSTAIDGGRQLVIDQPGTAPGGDGNWRAASVFDPVTDTLDSAPPLSCGNAGLAVRLDDGSVLVPCADPGASAAIYDPSDVSLRLVRGAGAWTDGAPLDSTRVLLMDDEGRAAILDTASETVTPVGSMVQPRGDGRSIALDDGRVLVTGGTYEGPLDSAELFDPATGVFREVGPMVASRWGHTVTRLADGRILLYGGARGLAAEVFDPAMVP